MNYVVPVLMLVDELISQYRFFLAPRSMWVKVHATNEWPSVLLIFTQSFANSSESDIVNG